MKSSHQNYRWVIAILCFAMFFLVIGLGNMPLNLYLVPVSGFFNFSRGEFSLVFSIIQITNVTIQLLYGYLEERLGVRVLITIGLLLMPVGYFIFSRVSNLGLFYVGAIFLGIGLSLASLTSVSVLVNNWFKKDQQGTLLGMIVAGSGFGGSLFSLIIGKQIITNGFQASFLLTSLILILGAIPIFLFVRSEPAEKKAIENGINSQIKVVIDQSSQKKANNGFLKRPYSVLALLSIFFIGISVAPTNTNVPAFLYEQGFDVVFAAQISSAIFFVQALAKILLGLINDRMGAQFCVYTGVGSYVVGTVILILAKSSWAIWAYVIFAGISMSTIAVIIPLFARAVIGKNKYKKYLGFFVATLFAGICLGNPLINFIYDASGTYKFIFSIFVFVGIAAIILSYLSLIIRAKEVRIIDLNCTDIMDKVN